MEVGMVYNDLVAMWNEESDENWDSISEKIKIEFAFDEGRRTGFIEIAKLAEDLSESKSVFLK
jgi:hypothetical protein